MVDTITEDDIAVTPPHMLADLAYHLGLVPGQLPDTDHDLVVIDVREPMYVPDGWHL